MTTVGTHYRVVRFLCVCVRRLGGRWLVNVENAWESSAKAVDPEPPQQSAASGAGGDA